MQNYKTTIGAILFLFIAIYGMTSVLGNQTGGISGLIKIVGVMGAIVALWKPKMGMYIILIESCYLDYFKKLATYHGLASTYTVIEVLSMSMLTLGCLGLGLLMRVMMTGRGFERKEWTVLIISVLLGAYFFSTSAGVGAVQKAVNGAGIMIVTLCMSVFFKTKEDYLNFARVMFWLLVPWAFLGLYQYFVGYSEMSLWYSNTNLSSINQSLEMLEMRDGYRLPIGFGSNKANYGIVGLLYLFALWHAVTFKRNRALYVFAFIICFTAILIAASRTSLFLPMIIFILYLMMKTRESRIILVSAIFCSVPILVVLSATLLQNMDSINEGIQTDGILANTMKFGSFSERLVSLKELANPDVWSLTGVLSKEDALESTHISDFGYSHSMIASILFRYGALGLLATILVLVYVSRKSLRAIASVKNEEDSKVIRFVFMQLLLIIIMTFIGGSNLHVQPHNIWLAVMTGLALGMLPSSKTAL